MDLKITRVLEDPKIDMKKAEKISEQFFLPHDLENNKNIFMYFKGKLIGLLSYDDNPVNSFDIYDIFVNCIFIDPRINYESGKPFGLGSRLVYELLSQEKGKIISLRATQNSMNFYEKIGFDILDGKKMISRDLSKIKKNLELRLQAPGYAKLTQNDLESL